MRDFAIQFFFRAIKDWRTYTGIIALIFAMTGSFIGHAVLLPTWLWWAAAVLSVGAIAVQAEWKLHQARSLTILPDMRLIDAIKRIVGSDALLSVKTMASVVTRCLQSVRTLTLPRLPFGAGRTFLLRIWHSIR